jgi:hypothetical protein
MNNTKFERLHGQAGKFLLQFAQEDQGLLKNVCTAQEVEQVITAKCGKYRDRVYSPLDTLRLFIGQVIFEDHACQDVVGRRLSERTSADESACSLNTGSYCKARKRMPEELPHSLLKMIGKRLEEQALVKWRWRGRAVKLFDGTTVSMPDTVSNQAAFPQSSEQKPGLGFPVARIGALIGLSTGAVLDYKVAACEGKGTGEQTLLRHLLTSLEAGDLLLADALFATYWLIADCISLGVDVVMAQHGRRTTDFMQGKLLGKRDHLIEWIRPKRPSWMSREEYEAVPEKLSMREAEIRGRVLVTTLLDANEVSPHELDKLYAMRWNIEVDFRTIKDTLKMDILRCKSKEMIEKEISVNLLAYNLVRWTMTTSAMLSDVLPRALSFRGAMTVLKAFGDHLRQNTGKRLSIMIETVMGSIASLKLLHRPDRIEPRAKKRRPKPLPLLTVPRYEAREAILAQRLVKVAP